MLAYEIVDVFTDRTFAGNPLAVVLDAEELEPAQMQSLAKEFNLSETAFPLRCDAEGVDYQLRIFTPRVELPFAGHPSVGTAWLMTRLGRVSPGRVVQRCGAGDLSLDVAADGSRVELTGGEVTLGEPIDPERLLAAARLEPEDLAGPPPRYAGAGLGWTYLQVRDDAVARAVADISALHAVADLAPDGLYVHSWDGAGRAHARGFAGDLGIAEDPATGSAALGLGVYLVANGQLAGDGEAAYVVRQGIEMGRPSTMHGRVEAAEGAAVRVRVAGEVRPVARGQIAIPDVARPSE
jgi:trans-2,3-dihydro-3-hydroxyanthranilate isomerase